MDEALRELERRYQETGTDEDGIKYLFESIRAGHAWDLDAIPRGWLNYSEVENSIRNSIDSFRGYELNGITLRQHVLDLSRDVGQLPIEFFPLGSHNDQDRNRSLDVDEGRYGPLVVGMCLCFGSHNDNPTTRLGLFTLIRHPTGCKDCGTVEAHHCTAFKHPYSNGYELPNNEQIIMGERLRDYPWLTTQQGDEYGGYLGRIESLRTWHPTQTSRQMVASWRYRLHLLIFEQQPRDDDNHFPHPITREAINTYWTNDYWYLNTIKSIASYRDFALHQFAPGQSRTEGRAPIFDIELNCSIGRIRPGYRRSGHYEVYTKCILIPIIDPRRHIPSEDPHEPIEAVPELTHQPCEDAGILPPLESRIRAWQLGHIRAEDVLEMSAHTVCGHGITIVNNQLIPLCPYRWSDSYDPVYDKCVICAAPIVLGARSSICPRCQRKIQLEYDAEHGNVPPPDPYYECPACKNHYDNRWQAEECEETAECEQVEPHEIDRVEPGYE